MAVRGINGAYGINEAYGLADSAEMMAVGVIVGVLLVYLLLVGLIIIDYILSSVALSKLASRRGISNSWMAWLPYAREWIIGSIVDDYEEKNGIKRKWRTVLLTLAIISIVGLVVVYIATFVALLPIAMGASAASTSMMLSSLGIIYVVIFIVAFLASAQGFCRAVCIYKIYESTVPEKAVKYFLIYLLVPLGGSICLSRCKNKGYPYPEEIAVPVAEVLEDSANVE